MTDTVNDAVTASATSIEFLSAYDQGFARVAAVTLPVVPVDPAANAAAIIEQARALADDGVCLAAFPELCLTGYAIDDLLLSDVLLSDVLAAIETLRAASAGLLPALVVGAPLRLGDRLYNCALVIQGGRVRGVAPKSYLPTYREFYEKRHFAPGDALPAGVESIELPGVRSGSGSADGVEPSARVPFGANPSSSTVQHGAAHCAHRVTRGTGGDAVGADAISQYWTGAGSSSMRHQAAT